MHELYKCNYLLCYLSVYVWKPVLIHQWLALFGLCIKLKSGSLHLLCLHASTDVQQLLLIKLLYNVSEMFECHLSVVSVVEPLVVLAMAYCAYVMAELFHWSGIIRLVCTLHVEISD